MKKLIPILTGIFLTITGFSQSCLPEGIYFETQAQIDSFQVNYPGCTQIEGDVIIYSQDEISSLNGLSVLTSIGGNLEIGYNIGLTNLTGLDNLITIGGNLWIYANFELTSLSGLENLTSIGGELGIVANILLTNIAELDNLDASSITNLFIYKNNSLSACDSPLICNYLISPNGTINIYLNGPGCNNPAEIANACGISLFCLPFGNYFFFTQTEVDSFQVNFPNCNQLEGDVIIGDDLVNNLNGLIHLSSIGGKLQIGEIPSSMVALTNLTGLDSLVIIGGDLIISNILHLDNISALGSLTNVTGDLFIRHNPSLQNLSGLENLNSIGGWLYLEWNNSLESLAGLDNIASESIDILSIYRNHALSVCDVQSICEHLADPNGSSHFEENATGCNSTLEVEEACAVNLTYNVIPDHQFSISPNPSSTRITIETSAIPAKFQISIFNLNGQELISQTVTDPVTVIDIDDLQPGVYFVRLTGKKIVGVEKFVKID